LIEHARRCRGGAYGPLLSGQTVLLGRALCCKLLLLGCLLLGHGLPLGFHLPLLLRCLLLGRLLLSLLLGLGLGLRLSLGFCLGFRLLLGLG